MRLSAPKVVTWWIAVILGILALLGSQGIMAGLSQYAFWLAMSGLALLACWQHSLKTSNCSYTWAPGLRIDSCNPGTHVSCVIKRIAMVWRSH
jgi:Na+-translocating ferredoxin:NAD+ oxidoreductase RnfD subunit